MQDGIRHGVKLWKLLWVDKAAAIGVIAAWNFTLKCRCIREPPPDRQVCKSLVFSAFFCG
jgi:hypothetical protein